jgi:hypothetical protein
VIDAQVVVVYRKRSIRLQQPTVKASNFEPHGNFGFFSKGVDFIKTRPTEK